MSNGGVGVLLGNGDGTFQSVVNYAATGMDTVSVGVGVFGDRNTPDIVALNYQTSDITVFPGNGDGTFGAGKPSPSAAIRYLSAVTRSER